MEDFQKRRRLTFRDRKHPKLEDVRAYPWKGGEWVVTYDPDDPAVNYRYQVTGVEGQYPGVVTIHGKVTSQGHPSKKPGDDITVLLAPQGSPYMAFVVPDGVEDESRVLEGYTDANLINYQIVAYLKTHAIKNHTVPMGQLMLYLQGVGVLSEDGDYFNPTAGSGKECWGKDYITASKLIKACIKASKGLLYMAGAYVKMNLDFKAMQPGGQVLDNRNAPTFVVIDRAKFIESKILEAESGILGFNIRWK